MGSLLHHVGSFTAESFAVARRLSSRGVTSVAPQHVGSELTRDQSSIAYISRWALNLRIIRKSLTIIFFLISNTINEKRL